MHGGEERVVMPPLSGELTAAPYISPPSLAWPWPGSGQFNSQFTQHIILSVRAPNTPWPSMSAQFGSWTTPDPLVTSPALIDTTASAGIWP